MLGYLLRFFAFVLLIRFVLRSLRLWLQPRPAARTPRASVAPARELVRDRVCNTFVAPERAVKAIVNGRPESFCSPACRDRALQATRAAS
jgi:hypothetical protein